MRSLRVVLGAAALAAGSAASVLLAAPASADATLPVSPTGSVTVTSNGNGHGHGMSQYGARGAALAGLSYQAISAFYYPHTTLTKIAGSGIRVKLTGFGGWTLVSSTPGLTVSGVGSIGKISSSIVQWRLVADSGSTLSLDYLTSAAGAPWKRYRSGLPNGSYFVSSTDEPIRLFRSDRTSVGYLGIVRAWRTAATGAAATYQVNQITLDRYTAGVAPREMPALWPTAAVRAQNVAARTYGRYAVEHPSASTYDICDTSYCQVYGGHVAYDRYGNVVQNDDIADAAATSNQVLLYGGHAAFSQFSASNGGWTVDGGQPYLVAQQDPYDSPASGDPYLNAKSTVPVPTIASSLGLAKVTAITITQRDGHGAWGGRVLAGYVDGTNSAGRAQRVTVTGFDLADALGLGTTWFTLAAS